MTPEERSSIENGIWLCQTCAKEIDSDEVTWTTARLHAEKRAAEQRAQDELGKTKVVLVWKTIVVVTVLGMLACVGVVALARQVWPGPTVVEPGRWIRFRQLSVYRVMPEPSSDAGVASHDSFVGVVLELKNESQDRTFEVQDLGFEGRLSFVPIEGGGLLSMVQALGAPSQVVTGFNLRPGSRGWAAIQFPLIHHDESTAPLGGVMPRFEGRWTVLVDGVPLVATPTTRTEGTVFLPKWKDIIEDINMKLEPVLKRGGPRGAWERLPSQ